MASCLGEPSDSEGRGLRPREKKVPENCSQNSGLGTSSPHFPRASVVPPRDFRLQRAFYLIGSGSMPILILH